jgi:hypothetical protein
MLYRGDLMRVSVALLATVAALAFTASASADPEYVETYNVIYHDFSYGFDTVCGLPELVFVDGQFQDFYHGLITGSGADFGLIRQTFHGEGVGATTGARYLAELDVRWYAGEHFPGTETDSSYRFRLMRLGDAGAGDDMVYTIRVGWVETPNGAFPVERDVVSVSCE